MDSKIICEICGHVHDYEEMTDVGPYGEEWVCEDCFNEHFIVCPHCNESVRKDESYYSDLTREYYCSYCFYDLFQYCTVCGTLMYSEDAFYEDDGPLCGDCYETAAHIHNYSYKPDPIFFKSSDENEPAIYFGFELEFDGKYDFYSKEEIEQTNKDFNEIYMKHDGSLQGASAEIVTHPMSYKYITETMDWDTLFQDTYYANLIVSKNTGMHVHVTRTKDLEDDIQKIYALLAVNKDTILEYVNRDEGATIRWAYFPSVEEITGKNFHPYNRYCCINLENYDTIEFRFFGGVDNKEDFMRNFNLLNKILDYAHNHTKEEILSMNFENLLEAKTA